MSNNSSSQKLLRGLAKSRVSWVMLKSWLLAFGLLLVLISSLSGCRSASSAEGNRIAPQPGSSAPDFTLYTLSGERVSLSRLKGQQVLLNFWATWCGPCRRELPYLEEAFQRKGAEVKFLGINLGESVPEVRQFVQANGISFIILAGAKTTDVAEAYNVRYIPTTFLIGKGGVVRSVKIGAFASLDEVLNFLREGAVAR